jgi:hypothetical protein
MRLFLQDGCLLGIRDSSMVTAEQNRSSLNDSLIQYSLILTWRNNCQLTTFVRCCIKISVRLINYHTSHIYCVYKFEISLLSKFGHEQPMNLGILEEHIPSIFNTWRDKLHSLISNAFSITMSSRRQYNGNKKSFNLQIWKMFSISSVLFHQITMDCDYTELFHLLKWFV